MDVAKVTRHVRPAHVIPALVGGTKDEVVRELCACFEASGALAKAKADALVKEVLERESEGTTGIGSGVALPHAKTPTVKELLVAVGISAKGIDFSSVDGDPVHVVFLIASPADAAQEYLALMRWVVSITRSKYWMRLLRASTTAHAVVSVLEEATVAAEPR